MVLLETITPNQAVAYNALLWLLPVLLSILAFIGALAVKSLAKMSDDLGQIKITCEVLITKHDDLERRVERVENKQA